jgi:hypothetical protein
MREELLALAVTVSPLDCVDPMVNVREKALSSATRPSSTSEMVGAAWAARAVAKKNPIKKTDGQNL